MIATMNLNDKLESVECRKDDKARRVSNVAPRTVANITADMLENGVTLEALDSLNVPVLRYSGQVTIHGKLPAFDPAARPGGYKAIVQNGNGSVGVRYSAIDAVKKDLFVRASRVTDTGWKANRNSTAFEVSRSFYVKGNGVDEQRASYAQAKVDALAALKSIPVARFYGSAFAYALAYGLGFGAAADIGAIPVDDVWPLIRFFFGLENEAALIAVEQVKQAEQDARTAQWDKEREARAAEQAAKLATVKASMGTALSEQPRTPGARFVVLSKDGQTVTVELSGKGKRLYYTVTARNGEAVLYPSRKTLDKGWPSAAAEGRLFPA